MKKVICSMLLMGAAIVGLSVGDELKIFQAVEIEFATVVGGTYQIQASSNMVEWVDCGDPIAGDGTTVNRLYSTKGTHHRFFRLISELPPVGYLTNYSDCKTTGAGAPKEGYVPSSSEECLQYEWQGEGTLALKHINAGFNCCPDRLIGLVAIQDNTITLTETEVGGLCNCNCLYDLDYEITNLKPGLYTLQVVPTGYVPPGDPPLTFAVDCTGPTNGIQCVRRSGYPWDLPAPTGVLVAYGTCKNSMGLLSDPAPNLDSPSLSEGCLEYQYEANSGTLLLTHVNAAFNCCPPIIQGEVTIADRQINIIEWEPGGMCFCLCLYDLSFEIHNLIPGTYTIDVSEPLLPLNDPRLTVTLDLATNPTGRVCLPRSSYPWGF
jgi:hypothetical protein